MSEEQAFQPEHDADVLVTPIRRRPRHRKRVYSHPTDMLRVLLSLTFIAMLVGGALYYVYANYVQASAPFAVVVGDKVLVVLRTSEDAETALLEVRKVYAPQAPEVVQFLEGTPELRPRNGQARYVSQRDAVELLKKHLTPVLDGYAIFVNGRPRMMLVSEEAAWEAISLALDRGLGDKQGIPTFKQRVTIAHLRQELDPEKQLIPVLSPQEAAVELVHPPRKRVHTVKRGDNFWLIATREGITVDDLVALNPGVNYKALREGDLVKLPDQPSPITVVVRQVVKQQPAPEIPKAKPQPNPAAPAQ